jgi:hypothetical protein
MNILAAISLIVLSVAIFSVTGRAAVMLLIAGALYLSESQGINVFGFNLFPTRVLELVLVARLTSRHEWRAIAGLNGIDRALLWLFGYTTLVFLVRSEDGQANQIGVAIDALIIYFSCRSLIVSPDDFRWILRIFVWMLIPYTLIVVTERLTSHDPLAFMGWGPGNGFSEAWFREGKVRCFGSFRHPSLLGTIGVGFIPLFIGMLFGSDRRRAVLGLVLCAVIVWATNSGGPISGVAFGCAAWACWRLRTRMTLVRRGIVAILIVALIFMKAPIWYLVAKFSEITGGDGWHRSYLMDVSYQHLSQWWLCGMPISYTAGWFPYINAGTECADITNQFVAFGLTAGLGSLALFILVLKRAFGALGKALHAVRAVSPVAGDDEYLLWGLGCMLAAHIVN